MTDLNIFLIKPFVSFLPYAVRLMLHQALMSTSHEMTFYC